MALQLIGPGSDNDALIAQMNNNISQLQQAQQTQIFKDNTGKARVLLGKASDGTYGLKVSQSGTDVTTATNSQLVFNSAQNTFKIIASGTAAFTPTNVGFTVAAGDLTLVIPHGLGYIPAAMVFSTVPEATAGFTGRTSLPYSDYFPNASPNVGQIFRTVYYDIDATNLTIHAFQSRNISYSAAPTYNVKYYLLQETAN